MLLSNLLSGVKVLSKYNDIEINDIKMNSEDDLTGCAYVCISGFKTDGHLYAKQAEEKGAAVIIAEHETGAEHQVLVSDTREVYAVMCANYFNNPAKDLTLVGVTGTNGKTSVATIIKRLLCFAHIKAGLISTIQAEYNDEIIKLSRTTPDAYELQKLFRCMADAGINIVVMEASSHALQQKRLFGLWFAVAIFTNLTQDHLDYHKTMEDYFLAKLKLFSMTDFAVINIDDKYGKRILSKLNVPGVSSSITDTSADYYADEIFYEADCVWFKVSHRDIKFQVSFGIPGLYSVHNSLAAIAACERIGIPLDIIIEGMKHVGTIKGRNELIQTGLGFRVICDYAHTPDGLENILKSTREYTKGKIILLFGCGGDRDREKRSFMGKVASQYADFLVITSDNPRTEAPGAIIADILKGITEKKKYVVIPERRDAIRYAITVAKKSDTVILAGKGHEQYQTLGEKNIYFDERRLVEGILRTLQK